MTDADPRLLPTFIVIGARKCGTTSLASYLGAHSQVFMTSPKEPSYFVRDRHTFDWYQSLFERAGDAKARGEASTAYTAAPRTPDAPERIHALIPGAKLVYLVRDPMERVLSHYAFRVAEGTERRAITDALKEGSPYVECSRYAYQLAPYLELFPRDQILVIGSRELRDDREATMQRVFCFIDVDPELPITGLHLEVRRTEDIRAPRRGIAPISRMAARSPLGLLPRSWKERLRHAARRKVPAPDLTLPLDFRRRLWDLYAADLEEFRKISDVCLELGPRP